MPKKGGPGGRSKPQHKGRARKFTSPEEMAAQMKEEEESRKSKPQGEGDVEESPQDRAGKLPPSDSEESEEEEEEGEEGKAKGVEGLIEIENPNRRVMKMQKATNVDVNQGAQSLSRREREEIEKQQARDRYMKAHQAGKTEEARADLARLAIIRKQREEAAKKKDAETKAKESQKAKGSKK